jgi:cytochrome b561
MPIRERYTLTAIWLHWIIAALMVANTALAWSVDYWPDEWVRPVIDMHKSIGVTAFGLVALRLLWRAAHAPPPLPTAYGRLERIGAQAGHGGLYLVMIALPFSGWLHDSAWKDWPSHPLRLFGFVPWPRIGFIADLAPEAKEHWHVIFGAAHHFIGYAFYALFAAHVLAALKHQFFDNERELQRMWPASDAGR